MLAATHAIAGAIFATQIADPKIALGLAFISHPFLDLCPHWDLNTRWAKRSYLNTFLLSAADAGIGFVIGFLLFGSQAHWVLLLSVMLVAQWPDWLEAPYHFGYKIPPFTWIKKLQHYWHSKLPLPWGLLPQLAILALAIYLHFR